MKLKDKRKSKWVSWLNNLKSRFQPKCDYRFICKHAKDCDQPLVKQNSRYGFSYCGLWREFMALNEKLRKYALAKNKKQEIYEE